MRTPAILLLVLAGCGGGGGSDPTPPAPTPPTLARVVPDTGFTPGGTTVTLTGTNFDGATTAAIGGVAVAVTLVDPTTLVATTPGHAAGAADVVVTNADGAATLPDAFTYYRDPPAFHPTDIAVSPGGVGAQDPAVCRDGDTVYVAWEDARDGELDVYVSRSTDGGATWGTGVRLDTDGAGAAQSVWVQVCCDGPRVYAVWQDARHGEPDIYFNRSLDGGATWLATDVRLDTNAAGASYSYQPRIRCDGDNVYVVWVDRRDGTFDVRFNRSADAGSTWLADDVRLDTDRAGAADSMDARLCRSGNNLYVVWEDSRTNSREDVYFNRSTDGGLTWLADDVRLDTDAPGAAQSTGPAICCEGDRIHVVWHDDRDGEFDVYFNRSLDGGLTWLANDVRVDADAAGAANSGRQQIACDGNELYVVWEDVRDGNLDVYFARSADGGATWTERRLDAGAADSRWPQIAVSDGRLHVTWFDDRDGAYDIYFMSSSDGGVTWPLGEVRLDTSAADSVLPRLCCDGARVCVVWQDDAIRARPTVP